MLDCRLLPFVLVVSAMGVFFSFFYCFVILIVLLGIYSWICFVRLVQSSVSIVLFACCLVRGF